VARVVVADDHPLFVEALKTALDAEGVEVVGVAERGDEVLDVVASTRPDAVLLDLKMPGADGYALLEQLRTQHPEIPVLVVSGADVPVAAGKALQLGAAGFVGKAVAGRELAHAVRVALGKQPVYYALPEDATVPQQRSNGHSDVDPSTPPVLTRRELEILQLAAGGLSNPAIAKQLWVTQQTVKFHISNVLRKLGVANRAGAVQRAHELGLLANPGQAPSSDPVD
jgi:DNA-binding NarL/FixJ family response regulator